MRRIPSLFFFAFVLTAVLGAQQPGTAPAQGRGQRPVDPRTAGGGQCSENPYNCIDTPNPLTPPDTVWLEEMTWMDVRDAMKAGKTTIIISTGGIEPNGPWLALGKHNYVLKANCDAIARKLGNALCAPIVPFVPEGGVEPKSGHMTDRRHDQHARGNLSRRCSPTSRRASRCTASRTSSSSATAAATSPA